jgi:hypothetical protein
MLAAAIVDWAALGKVVLYSFAAALLLTGLFTTGVLFVEVEGRSAPVARRALDAVCLALVAFGISVLFSAK